MAIASAWNRSDRSLRKFLIVGGFLITTILVFHISFDRTVYRSTTNRRRTYRRMMIYRTTDGTTNLGDPNDSIPTEGASSDDDNDGEWIFDSSLSQDDPKLLEFTIKNFLVPPSPLEYNLTSPLGDPAVKEKQNVYALKLLREKRNGFFIECGANNGEFISPTLVLERDHGWTGLLIEPDPTNYAALLSKHRKAWSSNTCLSIAPYPQKVSFAFTDNVIWSGLSGYKIESKNKIPNNTANRRSATCLPLFTLLSALKVKTVDFFALDVEGSELKILKTIPFDSVIFRVITIEYPHMPEGPDALKRFMTSKGYLYVRTMEGSAPDFMFVHNSLKENLHLAL